MQQKRGILTTPPIAVAQGPCLVNLKFGDQGNPICAFFGDLAPEEKTSPHMSHEARCAAISLWRHLFPGDPPDAFFWGGDNGEGEGKPKSMRQIRGPFEMLLFLPVFF